MYGFNHVSIFNNDIRAIRCGCDGLLGLSNNKTYVSNLTVIGREACKLVHDGIIMAYKCVRLLCNIPMWIREFL